MSGNAGLPPSGRFTLLWAVVRWLVAASAAAVVTLGVFATMTRLIDGTAILESIIRVFPLIQTELSREDACAAESRLGSAMTVDGVVGYREAGRFVPLPDATILGDAVIVGRAIALAAAAIPGDDTAVASPGTSSSGDGSKVPEVPDVSETSGVSEESTRTVEVSAEGVFRFVTAFASNAPSACGPAPDSAPRANRELVIRAEGCTERRIPVTSAWIPHRVLLDCAARGPAK
jgi:hypothetical protein